MKKCMEAGYMSLLMVVKLKTSEHIVQTEAFPILTIAPLERDGLWLSQSCSSLSAGGHFEPTPIPTCSVLLYAV